MSGSYWLELGPAPRFPASRGGRVDVAIVGAGITGCAAALRLAEAGLHVRVHEARRVASGASGRNGGFALRGGALRYDLAHDAYGGELARSLWRWSERYLDRLVELGGQSVRRTGSLRLAVDEQEREALRREFEALREDGFDAEWVDELKPPLGRFRAAIFHPLDASFEPARLTRGLARAAVEAGGAICEGDRVDDIESLDAEQVLLATNGYGSGLLPELGAAIRPVRNQVLLTEPLAGELFPRPHYARHGHAYWQQLPDRRLLLGGFRDIDPEVEATDVEATTPSVQAGLEGFLRQTLGVEATVERRWSGIFGLTADLLPLAGELRAGVWVAAGYSGHGNVLGLACGEAVADALLGRADPVLDLLTPSRKHAKAT